ncbi:hypothetical protein V5799_004782 [Amblyomma americanum]|uniref:Uncharacterized protein n=1 Tax=Amblyomma americanum TaxID=6943 RepID=A0AAQ4D546_AMBAM
MDDGSWKGENRPRDEDVVLGAEDGRWKSHDVALPALVASTVSGALHLWLLRPPAVVRRSAVAAAGAFVGALLVGCFVNIRRDARAKSEHPVFSVPFRT